LDIFGEDSVYQFINRTSTQSGSIRLAEWLKNPFLKKNEIRQRQEAIRELSVIPNWRINFLANGHLFKETVEMSHEIKAWSGTILELNRPRGIQWLIRLMSLFTLLFIIPAAIGFSWTSRSC